MIRTLAAAFLLLPVPVLVAGEIRSAPTVTDAFGYQQRLSPEEHCAHALIDVSDGASLALTAAGVAPADDDGGAIVTLPLPFEFYGREHASLVVSSNGYLAFAEGLTGEDGGHWRSDCPLPAIPDNRIASFARIYALGADLERGVGGALRWKHFAACPRAPSFGADACTVVEWQDWRRRGIGGTLNVQVVLYHARREIAIQYGALDVLAPASATVGIQDHGASSALLVGCGEGFAPEPLSAFCLFEPRFPAGEPGTPGPGDDIFGDGFE